jgi:hypothetical protein
MVNTPKSHGKDGTDTTHRKRDGKSKTQKEESESK